MFVMLFIVLYPALAGVKGVNNTLGLTGPTGLTLAGTTLRIALGALGVLIVLWVGLLILFLLIPKPLLLLLLRVLLLILLLVLVLVLALLLLLLVLTLLVLVLLLLVLVLISS